MRSVGPLGKGVDRTAARHERTTTVAGKSMRLPNLEEIEGATETVYRALSPTPQYAWPLLAEESGAEVWVKHENHTPIGAFKVRGGLVYLNDLAARAPALPGIASATRGNHGQSLAFAARALGIKATIFVPQGNSTEKNAAMRALGAELVEIGHDFQAAREAAEEAAAARGLHMVPSFHELLVRGVATYPLELFRAVPDLDTVYVPIGLGSGISATIAARDALKLRTKIVGVVAEGAAAYQLSFAAGWPVATERAESLADGMACRVPEPEAVAIVNRGAERIVSLSEAEIAGAMRALYRGCHNLAEGAGAAAYGALLKEREAMRGKKVGVVLSGGNVDAATFREVLAGA